MHEFSTKESERTSSWGEFAQYSLFSWKALLAGDEKFPLTHTAQLRFCAAQIQIAFILGAQIVVNNKKQKETFMKKVFYCGNENCFNNRVHCHGNK